MSIISPKCAREEQLKRAIIMTALMLERVMGIEPTQPAWKAGALPLSHTRKVARRRGKRGIGADEEI